MTLRHVGDCRQHRFGLTLYQSRISSTRLKVSSCEFGSFRVVSMWNWIPVRGMFSGCYWNSFGILLGDSFEPVRSTVSQFHSSFPSEYVLAVPPRDSGPFFGRISFNERLIMSQRTWGSPKSIYYEITFIIQGAGEGVRDFLVSC